MMYHILWIIFFIVLLTSAQATFITRKNSLTVTTNLHIQQNLTVTGFIYAPAISTLDKSVQIQKSKIETLNIKQRLLDGIRFKPLDSATWAVDATSSFCSFMPRINVVMCWNKARYGYYDLKSFKWNTDVNNNNLPTARGDVLASVYYDGATNEERFLVGYGYESGYKNDLWSIGEWSYRSSFPGSWTSLTVSNTPPASVLGRAIYFLGRIWSYGRGDGGGFHSVLYEFDMFNLNVNPHTHTVGNPGFHGSLVGAHDYLFYVGGRESASNHVPYVYKYGPIGNSPSWTQLADWPNNDGVSNSVALFCEPYIYVIHGMFGNGAASVSTVLKYNIHQTAPGSWDDVTSQVQDNPPGTRWPGYAQIADNVAIMVAGETSSYTTDVYVISV